MIYLNHAGTSWPKPISVLEAAAAAVAAPPTTWGDPTAGQAVGRAFGVAAERLLFTPACTSALHLAVADLPWRPGDVMLLGAFEHLALERPARALAARGVRLEIVPPEPDGGPVDVAWVQARLARGDVRLLAVSAAASVTGAIAPLAQLQDLVRRAGARMLVDAAQAVGWLPLDLAGAGFDLVAFGAHKGTQGIWGVGALYAAEDVRFETPRDGEPAPGPSWCDAGSLDRPALAGWAAGLAWLDAPERADRLARGRRQIDRLQAALIAHPGVRILGPLDVIARTPTVAAAVAGLPLPELGQALRARSVIASTGLQCAPLAHRTLGTHREGGAVRLSVGPSTTDEEIAEAVAQLDAVLRAR